MKKCPRCLEDKSKGEFYKDAASKDGLTLYCRQCKNQMSKEYYVTNKERVKKNAAAWKEKNPDKVKEHAERERSRTYGITIEHYNNLLDQQNNCCAICREEDKSGRALAVDHDHSCCPGKKSCGKCVRQLLCMRCNSILGYTKDNIELLKKAAKYVERHSQRLNSQQKF